MFRPQAATVGLYGVACALLTRDGAGEYNFRYLPEHVASGGPPVSISLPVIDEAYRASELFAYFDNLVAEGWLLEQQSNAARVNKSDRLALLIQNGLDLPGAITIERNHELQHLLEGAEKD